MTSDRNALILIVDDDWDFLELNRFVLENAGYRVMTAAEPELALERMAKEKPDLVISDLMMTSLDSGFSFARSLKEDPAFAGIPVIIVTSVINALGLDFRPRSDSDMIEAYIDAYFDKPVDYHRLLDKIGELLSETPKGTSPAEADEEV
jgi:CheY-like chemotaxis protein